MRYNLQCIYQVPYLIHWNSK